MSILSAHIECVLPYVFFFFFVAELHRHPWV